ncbi:endo-1,4-beta-xylanase [uncultured Fibrobacter sp.]|uniref:endo-1,4-beta-xylanase n=1 Tax=uncultured Fibrobacter sp. TaxID=261512 RepID=UPI002610D235|nr:endo-1,4-beta-xylanase [uncultured Fibrobacter sp.]
MSFKKSVTGIALGATLIGTGFTSAFAADETLRSLAEERGRYIGAILNSEWFGGGWGASIEPEFEQIHKVQFNAVVAENEMKFDATEPSENNFNYDKGDKMIKYAQENGMRVRGHALAWHSQVPSWVNSYSGQKDKLLAVLKNHIEHVVGHWKGQVAEWDVVNEAVNDNNPHGWRSSGSVWYEGIGPEFLDSAFVWAHAADPDAELCYNDYAIEWGLSNGSKASFVLEQVKRWKANGIPITCVGTQTHIEISHETTPQNIRAFAKALAELDVKLNITELDIGFPQGSANSLGASDYAKQGHLYRQFMDVFLEEPNMGEFVIWGLTDAHSWLDGSQGKTQGLLWDKNYKAKPAFDSVMASLKAHPIDDVVSPYGLKAIIDPPCEDACGDSIDAIKTVASTSNLSMSLTGRTLSIAGATAAKVDVFDMQGRPVFSEKNVKGSVELSGLSEGLYIVRMRDGSKNLTQKIAIK